MSINSHTLFDDVFKEEKLNKLREKYKRYYYNKRKTKIRNERDEYFDLNRRFLLPDEVF